MRVEGLSEYGIIRPLNHSHLRPVQFDWSLTVWLGVYDLAYAIVQDWDTPLRRQWEFPMLRR